MKEGYLMIREAFKSNWHQRFCKLNGTTLSLWDDDSLTNLKGRYRINNQVSLGLKSSTVLCLTFPGSSSLRISVESPDDMVEWYNAFKTVNSDTYQIGVDSFDFIKKVGIGQFGEVSLVKMYETNEIVAVKISTDIQTAHNESEVLKTLIGNHFFVQFRFYFEFQSKSYLGIEYASGGDLLNRFNSPLTYHDALLYSAEILDALSFLHQKGILFRDLKPENILLSESGHIKFTDFGLSQLFEDNADGISTEFAGTEEYSSPEVITSNCYSKESDIWSYGVVLYSMFYKQLPFYSKNPNKTRKLILEKELEFPTVIKVNFDKVDNEVNQGEKLFKNLQFSPEDISSIITDLNEVIIACLQKDPSNRPTQEMLLKFKFFEKIDWNILQQLNYSFNTIITKELL